MNKPRSKSFVPLVIFLLIVAVAVFFLYPVTNTETSIPQIDASEFVARTTTATVESNAGQEIDGELDVKVFMYHHVGPLPDKADEIRKGLTVSEQEFEQQIKYLSEQGYKIMSLAKLDEAISKKNLPKKVVVATFDDGYDDNYNYALPILKRYGAAGTFFIIAGKVGKSEYMNEDQVKEISNAGNEIGSHSVNHPSLEKYRGETLKGELVKSKQTLEELISKPVISFCYPAGKYNDQTIVAVKDAGYKYAVTTRSSTGILNMEKLFEIPRYRISSGRNIEAMLK